MTGRLDRFDDHLGVCPACGKIRYRSRTSARHAARRMSRRRLDTSGYYAATELQAGVDVIRTAANRSPEGES